MGRIESEGGQHEIPGNRDSRAEGRCAGRHQEGDCRLCEQQRRNGLRGRRRRRHRTGRRRRRRVRPAGLQHGARRRETGCHHVRQLRNAQLRREGGRGRQGPARHEPPLLHGEEGPAPRGRLRSAGVLLRPGDRCGHPADDQGDRRRQLRGHALPRPRAHL